MVEPTLREQMIKRLDEMRGNQSATVNSSWSVESIDRDLDAANRAHDLATGGTLAPEEQYNPQTRTSAGPTAVDPSTRTTIGITFYEAARIDIAFEKELVSGNIPGELLDAMNSETNPSPDAVNEFIRNNPDLEPPDGWHHGTGLAAIAFGGYDPDENYQGLNAPPGKGLTDQARAIIIDHFNEESTKLTPAAKKLRKIFFKHLPGGGNHPKPGEAVTEEMLRRVLATKDGLNRDVIAAAKVEWRKTIGREVTEEEEAAADAALARRRGKFNRIGFVSAHIQPLQQFNIQSGHEYKNFVYLRQQPKNTSMMTMVTQHPDNLGEVFAGFTQAQLAMLVPAVRIFIYNPHSNNVARSGAQDRSIFTELPLQGNYNNASLLNAIGRSGRLGLKSFSWSYDGDFEQVSKKLIIGNLSLYGDDLSVFLDPHNDALLNPANEFKAIVGWSVPGVKQGKKHPHLDTSGLFTAAQLKAVERTQMHMMLYIKIPTFSFNEDGTFTLDLRFRAAPYRTLNKIDLLSDKIRKRVETQAKKHRAALQGKALTEEFLKARKQFRAKHSVVGLPVKMGGGYHRKGGYMDVGSRFDTQYRGTTAQNQWLTDWIMKKMTTQEMAGVLQIYVPDSGGDLMSHLKTSATLAGNRTKARWSAIGSAVSQHGGNRYGDSASLDKMFLSVWLNNRTGGSEVDAAKKEMVAFLKSGHVGSDYEKAASAIDRFMEIRDAKTHDQSSKVLKQLENQQRIFYLTAEKQDIDEFVNKVSLSFNGVTTDPNAKKTQGSKPPINGKAKSLSRSGHAPTPPSATSNNALKVSNVYPITQAFQTPTVIIPYAYLGDILDAVLETSDYKTAGGINADTGLPSLRFILGFVTYKDYFHGTPGFPMTITLPIVDIPIPIEMFTAWWHRNYTLVNKTTLTLAEFLKDAMTSLVYPILNQSTIRHISNPGKVDIGRYSFTSDTDLKSGLIDWSKLRGLAWPGNNTTHAIPSSYVFYNTSFGSNEKYKVEDDPRKRRADSAKSKPLELVVGTARGLLKKVEFQKMQDQDFEGHLIRMDQDTFSGLGIGRLRIPYNANVTMVGNNLVFPGTPFSIKPATPGTRSGQAADNLGLGGYYIAQQIDNKIEVGVGWETSFTAINVLMAGTGKIKGHGGKNQAMITNLQRENLDRKLSRRKGLAAGLAKHPSKKPQSR